LVIPLLLTRRRLLPASADLVALLQVLLILLLLRPRRVSFASFLSPSTLRLEIPSSLIGELTTTLLPNLPLSLLATKRPITLLVQESRTGVLSVGILLDLRFL
jgi:hypothetical protein